MSLLKKRLILNLTLTIIGAIIIILPFIFVFKFTTNGEEASTDTSNSKYLFALLAFLCLFVGMALFVFPCMYTSEILKYYVPESKYFMAYGPRVYNTLNIISIIFLIPMGLCIAFIFVFKKGIFITLSIIFFVISAVIAEIAFKFRKRYFQSKGREYPIKYADCPKCGNGVPYGAMYCLKCNKMYTKRNLSKWHTKK